MLQWQLQQCSVANSSERNMSKGFFMAIGEDPAMEMGLKNDPYGQSHFLSDKHRLFCGIKSLPSDYPFAFFVNM